jgi:predicted Rossmann fold flavoprotein
LPSQSEQVDVAVIGAGAAGLFAAAFAGREAGQFRAEQSVTPSTPMRIVALDGAKKLGAKILVAGGGRCNVTHHLVKPDDFTGTSKNSIAKVLRAFDVTRTIDFFSQLGVTLKREPTGKLFPDTDEAQTVLDALLRAATDAGAELRTDSRVLGIERAENGFHVHTVRGTLHARAVVLATGGLSLPKTGSDGIGYALAKSLGHTVTTTTPALVPLVLPSGHWLTDLSGIAIDTQLCVHSGSGKVIARHAGAMLLTHFGVSGPAVLDISRHWLAAKRTDAGVRLTANLLPDCDFAAVEKMILDAAQSLPRSGVVTMLRQRFPERLADAICRAAGVEPSLTLSQLDKAGRRSLTHTLTALELPVVRDRGYLFAEVTAGGVPLTEIDPATMQSRVCPGLFLCGEVLDCDGRIGGFNFQWAWASGHLAGTHAARLSLNAP